MKNNVFFAAERKASSERKGAAYFKMIFLRGKVSAERKVPALLFFVALNFLSLLPVFSQSQKRLTYAMIMKLDILPVSEKNYAGQECCFELKIPYTKADAVQSTIPDLPSGVSFVSLRRSEYSDEEFGTKIELWLNFSEPGTYKLRFMRIIINGNIYSIPFAPITISENPRDMLPQLVIAFDNGKEFVQQKRAKNITKALFSAQEGENLHFTVYLQYAVQLVNFWWSVPKNSIFVEDQRFEINQGNVRNSEFSEERLPVASFDWKPLVQGNAYLPEMHFVATSYNGSRVELSTPTAFITVLEGENRSVSRDNPESLFANVFSTAALKNDSRELSAISHASLEKLAGLRSLEKKSLPFGKASRERKEFEESLGISGEDSEVSYVLFYIIASLAALSVLILLICWIFKRVSGVILSSVFFLAFFALSFVVFVKIKTPSAIFAGGKVRAVPEVEGEIVEAIPSGKKVRIEEKAGSWYFIRYGSASGWTDENAVILIE